jgi:hypothetical protein
MNHKTKEAPMAGTVDASQIGRQTHPIIAHIANPEHPMPRTFDERARFYRSTCDPEHSAIQLGEALSRKALHAIIKRELAGAVESFSEQDLFILVESFRLCRELHGEDACQAGNLTGAILQTLGFGAGHVTRTDEGEELEVHMAPTVTGGR